MTRLYSIVFVSLIFIFTVLQTVFDDQVSTSIYSFFSSRDSAEINFLEKSALVFYTATIGTILLFLGIKIFQYGSEFIHFILSKFNIEFEGNKNISGWWVYSIMVNSKSCDMHDKGDANGVCYLYGKKGKNAPYVKTGYFRVVKDGDNHKIVGGKIADVENLEDGTYDLNLMVSSTHYWRSIEFSYSDNRIFFVFDADNTIGASKVFELDSHYGVFDILRQYNKDRAISSASSVWLGKYEDKGHPDKYGCVYAERINSISAHSDRNIQQLIKGNLKKIVDITNNIHKKSTVHSEIGQ